MTKSLCTLTRRHDFSRADFQAYYEQRHVPLALSHFPFRRYVRNHLVDMPDIGFDTISEFWSDDSAATAGLMDGPVGEIMRADERRFMDRARIAPAGAEEHVLSDGAPANGERLRYAALLDWHGEDPELVAALLAWGRDLAARQPGVSIDFARSWTEQSFPARAVLWSPAAPPPPPASVRSRIVRVRREETPEAQLLRAGHAGAA